MDKSRKILAVLMCFLMVLPSIGLSDEAPSMEISPTGRPVPTKKIILENEANALEKDPRKPHMTDPADDPGVPENPDSPLSVPEERSIRDESRLTADEEKRVLELYDEYMKVPLRDLQGEAVTARTGGATQDKYEYTIARILIEDYKSEAASDDGTGEHPADDPARELVVRFYEALEDVLEQSIVWTNRQNDRTGLEEFVMPESVSAYLKSIKEFGDKVWSGSESADETITKIILPLIIILGPGLSNDAAAGRSGPDPFVTVLRRLLVPTLNGISAPPRDPDKAVALQEAKTLSAPEAPELILDERTIFSGEFDRALRRKFQAPELAELWREALKPQSRSDTAAKMTPLVRWAFEEFFLKKDWTDRPLLPADNVRKSSRRAQVREGVDGYTRRVMEMINLPLGDILEKPSLREAAPENRDSAAPDPVPNTLESGFRIVRELVNQDSLQKAVQISAETRRGTRTVAPGDSLRDSILRLLGPVSGRILETRQLMKEDTTLREAVSRADMIREFKNLSYRMHPYLRMAIGESIAQA